MHLFRLLEIQLPKPSFHDCFAFFCGTGVQSFPKAPVRLLRRNSIFSWTSVLIDDKLRTILQYTEKLSFRQHSEKQTNLNTKLLLKKLQYEELFV